MVTEQQVIEVIAKALNIKNEEVTALSSTANVESWDSLGHLSILTALDKKFDGKVAEIGEMAEAESLDKIINLLKSNSLI